jgi:hypothetical protein
MSSRKFVSKILHTPGPIGRVNMAWEATHHRGRALHIVVLDKYASE